MNFRTVIGPIARVLDILLIPFIAISGLLLKCARRIGLHRLPVSRFILTRIGILPLRRHYYEPWILPQDLCHGLDIDRDLPGIDWDIPGQLALLDSLRHEHELNEVIRQAPVPHEFSFGNGSFESGDAEYLYQIVRRFKPKRIVEIGSGQSTLIVRAAIARNREELQGCECEHICVEPYEAEWLEGLGINVIRQRVEQVDRSIFAELREGDLLFIDSSHVIRPQGDVVTEFLEILPRLQRGVIVHIHDVFSPRDYPTEWVFSRMMLWNEQYLLEAFLTNNKEWKVLGAINFLKHHYFESLHRVCPFLTPDREPGSMYIQKI